MTCQQHFTSNDLTCDLTWIQIYPQNDDVTRHKSCHGVGFASGFLDLKVPTHDLSLVFLTCNSQKVMTLHINTSCIVHG